MTNIPKVHVSDKCPEVFLAPGSVVCCIRCKSVSAPSGYVGFQSMVNWVCRNVDNVSSRADFWGVVVNDFGVITDTTAGKVICGKCAANVGVRLRVGGKLDE